MKERLTVTEADGVVRIDKFLAVKFPEYSRAAITKLFDLKLIKRDGLELRPGEKVRPGTEIEYDLGPLQTKPEVIQLPVLYEDDNVIVVDKPAGIISHARGKFWQEASVASFIRDKIKGMDGERGGIVHRLDRATSGVMVCAKNESTLKYLQKQFHDRTVMKSYVAIINGTLEHTEATIDAPIERDARDPKRFKVSRSGKPAQTEYVVQSATDTHSMLSLKPKTGRTHQLRLHLKYIGKPIVGDELYGGEAATRLMLHAESLSVQLPSGKRLTFTSPLPKEFETYT